MNLNNPKPYTFDRVVRIVISLLILAAIIYFLVVTKTALIPFFVAWLIAYLINPIVLYVQRILRLKSKLLPIAIVLVLGLLLLGGLLRILIPRFILEFEKIVTLLNDVVQQNHISSLLPENYNEKIIAYLKSSELFRSLSAGDATELIKKTFTLTWNILSESITLILSVLGLFISFIYLIFILKDYENVTQGAVDLIPPKYKDRALVILEDVEVGMNRYYRGQSLVALSVGILLSIGFQIISLPMGIMLGMFIGLLNLIPYLQIVGLLPMALAALLKTAESGDSFIVTLGLAMLVLAVVQIIQDTILVPKIMGRVTGLNPVVILLSLSIWGILLGVIGMIIALPFTTILLSYYKRFIINKEPIQNLENKNNT